MATKVEYKFDPFELVGIKKSEIPKDKRDELLDEIADFVLESVLSDVGSARSPVNGSKFPGLSSEYKANKIRKGARPIANLELEGDLLDSLKVRKNHKEELLTLTVDPSQMPKADGHNNFSGDSMLPERKFIPNKDKDESFRPGIVNEIKRIILDALE